ncbi:MAG: endonuclease/exonuclease/phosphatase family protein [Spirochaetales bacterium]|nr:endonuclease/exonuclease/phosphatase family protein [Spirochaetales bacterium]
MKRKSIIFYLTIIAVFFYTAGCGNARTVTILSYNVENLFDDVDNGTEYKEYDPGGSTWNRELMQIKLENIAKAIRESVPGGPDIVCLQEIENQNVLDILNAGYLSGLNYRYAAVASLGRTVTNVAFLSRLPVVRTHIHSLPDWKGDALRGILEFEIEYRGALLYIFNNHWKSKSGGEKKTEQARLLAAELLISRVKTVLAHAPQADIVILGDLNECYDEYYRINAGYQTALVPEQAVLTGNYGQRSLFLSDNPENAGIKNDGLIFYENWYSIGQEQRGSYVYRSTWQTLDHILLSGGLFDASGFSYTKNGFSVVRLAFLCDPETGYPLRWKVKSVHKGFSDHLPLLLKLIVNQ